MNRREIKNFRNKNELIIYYL